jgi:hypothetical protein
MIVRISRRDVLGAGTCVLTLGYAHGSSTTLSVKHRPELFVFQSCNSRNLVFAVVVASPGPPTTFDVHLHAGPKSWTIANITVSERSDSRLFAGEVLGPCTAAGIRYTAVVLETQPDFVRPHENLAVWAEIRTGDGSRVRVGNPFVANLLARDPVLSGTYHATSPAQDRALFTDPLASRIQVIAAATGLASPDGHARRLAARLLPDVINYRPDLPVGFNFASQNGRHPSDDTATVVETVLTGTVAPRMATERVQLTKTFPYIQRPIVT